MIGKNINMIRKQKKMTLSELADRANISKSYLSNLERNLNQNPSIQIVEKIANVLGVDLRSLLLEKQTDKKKLDREWVEFIKELQATGIEKEQLPEFKTVIEFVKWQNENQGKKEKSASGKEEYHEG